MMWIRGTFQRSAVLKHQMEIDKVQTNETVNALLEMRQ